MIQRLESIFLGKLAGFKVPSNLVDIKDLLPLALQIAIVILM